MKFFYCSEQRCGLYATSLLNSPCPFGQQYQEIRIHFFTSFFFFFPKQKMDNLFVSYTDVLLLRLYINKLIIQFRTPRNEVPRVSVCEAIFRIPKPNHKSEQKKQTPIKRLLFLWTGISTIYNKKSRKKLCLSGL